jgi:hypothetical protein
MKQARNASYWGSRLREDAKRIDESTKKRLLKSFLVHTTVLKPREVDLFLAPKEELSSSEAIMAYAIVERKIAEEFGGESPEDFTKRDRYLEELKSHLSKFYTPPELDEIIPLILSVRDASTLTTWLAGDHYGFRRIRNAYLPEITDLVEINPETGKGRITTNDLFVEGPTDAVAQIEKLLGQ